MCAVCEYDESISRSTIIAVCLPIGTVCEHLPSLNVALGFEDVKHARVALLANPTKWMVVKLTLLLVHSC